MAAAAFYPTKVAKGEKNGSYALDFAAGSFKALWVVAGGGIPDTSKTGVEFLTGLLGSNAEVSGGTYARKALASLTWAFDGIGTRLVDWGFANLTWAQDAAGPATMRYLVIVKDTGSDATSPVVDVFDPNATYSMVTGDVVVSAPTGGAIQAQC